MQFDCPAEVIVVRINIVIGSGGVAGGVGAGAGVGGGLGLGAEDRGEDLAGAGGNEAGGGEDELGEPIRVWDGGGGGGGGGAVVGGGGGAEGAAGAEDLAAGSAAKRSGDGGHAGERTWRRERASQVGVVAFFSFVGWRRS